MRLPFFTPHFLLSVKLRLFPQVVLSLGYNAAASPWHRFNVVNHSHLKNKESAISSSTAVILFSILSSILSTLSSTLFTFSSVLSITALKLLISTKSVEKWFSSSETGSLIFIFFTGFLLEEVVGSIDGRLDFCVTGDSGLFFCCTVGWWFDFPLMLRWGIAAAAKITMDRGTAQEFVWFSQGHFTFREFWIVFMDMHFMNWTWDKLIPS